MPVYLYSNKKNKKNRYAVIIFFSNTLYLLRQK